MHCGGRQVGSKVRRLGKCAMRRCSTVLRAAFVSLLRACPSVLMMPSFAEVEMACVVLLVRTQDARPKAEKVVVDENRKRKRRFDKQEL